MSTRVIRIMAVVLNMIGLSYGVLLLTANELSLVLKGQDLPMAWAFVAYVALMLTGLYVSQFSKSRKWRQVIANVMCLASFIVPLFAILTGVIICAVQGSVTIYGHVLVFGVFLLGNFLFSLVLNDKVR